jgi:mannan endo-1,4-beta-mannosidase
MRAAIKNRLSFAAERWGGSGVLFAWDLWNELPPAKADHHATELAAFIHDVSQHLRAVETRCFGRAHLQTVSVFGPVLKAHPSLGDLVFRHPDLDFATSHFYDAATISRPQNALDPALHTAELVSQAIAQLPTNRPFFDSEHGPLDTFKGGRQLPEAFDDEYFRCMQWAHLAAGGVGGGLRWPYRYPHVLTHGMRTAQRSLAGFVELLNWAQFQRYNLTARVLTSTTAVRCVACGDGSQAVVWLVRPEALTTRTGRQQSRVALDVQLLLSDLRPGSYQVYIWDTKTGQIRDQLLLQSKNEQLAVLVSALVTDVALAIKPAS